jgi:hypothetical protein
VLFGTLAWAFWQKEPEAPIVYQYLEPPLEEVEKSLLVRIGKKIYRDVAVYREIPVMVPDELLQAAITRNYSSRALTAVDLPWTVPDSELTYICTATLVRSNEKLCALLRLHKVPDTPAWFGTVDFGVGRPGRIVFVRTSWIPLPPVSVSAGSDPCIPFLDSGLSYSCEVLERLDCQFYHQKRRCKADAARNSWSHQAYLCRSIPPPKWAL